MYVVKSPADANRLLKTEKNLTQQVYYRIKAMMLNYEIIPGQRLIFSDLGKRFGVSRTPVNNALSILAKERFLDFIPHQGYTVHEISSQEAESLYEIIHVLQLGAISKAIRRLTPEKCKTLEEHKNRHEKAVADGVTRGLFMLDQEFHAYIIEMSDNIMMADHFRESYQRIFLRHRIEGLGTGRVQQVLVEHNQIFEAIAHRDVEDAREQLSAHLTKGKNYIFSVIFEPEKWDV